jgi:hypothetical protein
VPNNINISSVISSDILKTISASTAVKTFGSQLINKQKEKILVAVVGKAEQLKKQIEEITTLLIKVDIDHSTEVKRLEILLKENQITQEQYDKALAAENEAYFKKKEDLEALKIKLQQDLKNVLADPLSKIKENRNKRKLKKAKRKSRNKAERSKARRALAKKVARNAAKTLAPILALQMANKFSSVLSQRSQLEKLVDQVNTYIEQANTPETIVIATNLRNNTIALINNSINKLQNIQRTIAQINVYISVFTVIVAVLSAIPIPTAVPPGIGIPVSLIMRIVKSLERASKLIISLNVISAIVVVILENEIVKLNELIERLKAVNQLLDGKTAGLNEQQLTDISNTFLPTNSEFEQYKGFKFKIKVEENKAFEVKGNKRRYAVAIDRDGVDVLKSELSFTLDPQDLVDQLKLVIDQRNLQG